MRSSPNYQIIRDAIINCHQVTGYYGGFYREFCPYRLGQDDGGEYRVFAYQFGGQTSKGPIVSVGSRENWRCFKLMDISDLQSRPGTWYGTLNPISSGRSECVTHLDFESACPKTPNR